LFISSALIFLIAYAIFLYTLEKFIYSKIRLIYQIIHSVKVGKRERPLLQTATNIIDNVQEEVENWEAEKQLEIEQFKRWSNIAVILSECFARIENAVVQHPGYVSTLLDGGLEDPAINREYLIGLKKALSAGEDTGRPG